MNSRRGSNEFGSELEHVSCDWLISLTVNICSLIWKKKMSLLTEIDSPKNQSSPKDAGQTTEIAALPLLTHVRVPRILRGVCG
jgi:hypothetical protein